MMIQGVAGPGFPPPNRQVGTMTDQQSEDLAQILSSYDPEALSEADAVEIADQIRELGLTPRTGLSDALKDAGYDPKALAELAGIERKDRPPGPPRGDRPNADGALVEVIADAVKTYAQSDQTDTLWSVLEPALQEAGYDTSRPVIDRYA